MEVTPSPRSAYMKSVRMLCQGRLLQFPEFHVYMSPVPEALILSMDSTIGSPPNWVLRLFPQLGRLSPARAVPGQRATPPTTSSSAAKTSASLRAMSLMTASHPWPQAGDAPLGRHPAPRSDCAPRLEAILRYEARREHCRSGSELLSVRLTTCRHDRLVPREVPEQAIELVATQPTVLCGDERSIGSHARETE